MYICKKSESCLNILDRFENIMSGMEKWGKQDL